MRADSVDDLPFDIRSQNCVVYDSIRQLRDGLESSLRDIEHDA